MFCSTDSDIGWHTFMHWTGIEWNRFCSYACHTCANAYAYIFVFVLIHTLNSYIHIPVPIETHVCVYIYIYMCVWEICGMCFMFKNRTIHITSFYQILPDYLLHLLYREVHSILHHWRPRPEAMLNRLHQVVEVESDLSVPGQAVSEILRFFRWFTYYVYICLYPKRRDMTWFIDVYHGLSKLGTPKFHKFIILWDYQHISTLHYIFPIKVAGRDLFSNTHVAMENPQMLSNVQCSRFCF